MKKILTFGITLLFVLMTVSSANEVILEKQSYLATRNGKTLYVGGSGPGNYTNIQDAINDASDGDTVFVYNGTYYEKNIEVDKSIDLIGEYRYWVVIDGNNSYSSVIRIYADRVNISGFTIQNSNRNGISIRSNNNSITGNIIKDNDCGIWIWGGARFSGANNTISNNIIKFNGCGVQLNYTAYNNTISRNDIYLNSGGVYLEPPAHYNNISNNIISNHSYSGIGISSTHNVVTSNIISNNSNGIRISNISNFIHGNLITDNENGIQIEHWYKSINNSIYHNNFFNNTNQEYDEGNNYWDDGYTSGGNYWSDYTGNDSNGDGIGDTPYNISGGDNQDRYPLMEPWTNETPYARFTWKPLHPKPGKTLIFNASKSYDPNGHIILYEWDWNNDGEYDENHTIPTTTHSWPIGGRYPIILRVTDNSSKTGKTKRILIVNTPPNTPTIDGPKNGKKGIEYNYTFNATDPDEDNIKYYVEWGDADTVGTGYNPSGKAVTLKHSWQKRDVYIIRCKSIDMYGNESDWGMLEVTVPKNRNVFFSEWLDRFPLLNQFIMRITERWSI